MHRQELNQERYLTGTPVLIEQKMTGINIERQKMTTSGMVPVDTVRYLHLIAGNKTLSPSTKSPIKRHEAELTIESIFREDCGIF